MTKVLEQAFAKAATLPEAEQDEVGRFLIAEIDDEADWNMAFSATQSELACMAREALAEYDAGQTQPLDTRRDL